MSSKLTALCIPTTQAESGLCCIFTMCPELLGFVMPIAVRGTSSFSFSSDRIRHLSLSSVHLLPFLQIVYLLLMILIITFLKFLVLLEILDIILQTYLCQRIYY